MARSPKLTVALAALPFAGLAALALWTAPAAAEHMCQYPGSDEVITAEIVGPGAGYYMCEWVEPGQGDYSEPRMSDFSPDQWDGFWKHQAKKDTLKEGELILMSQRHKQLEKGMWFMPGEEPFAGWVPGSTAAPAGEQKGCTASFWTLDGAVILSTIGGADGVAVLSYKSHSIPVPNKGKFKTIALTQSGRTQTVKAFVSGAGRGKGKMGMVSFAVPSGKILVNAIEDTQDYSLADDGKVIFSGQWHDGLKARDALARCLAKKS